MKVLGSPWPTDEQLKIIADVRTGTEIIRGAAGSGKTTTALLRLRNLTDMFRSRHARLHIQSPVKALVLTYNRTLCGYVEALAEEQASSAGGVELEVATFASWAMRFTNNRDIIGRDEREYALARLSAKYDIKLSSTFLASEVEYLRGRFTTHDYKNYLDAERTGRGIAPRVEKATREKILTVIDSYNKELLVNQKLDWEDITAAAAAAPSAEYQIIVVDEAQDFSATQIKALRKHLADQHAFTLVVDTAQRLYPRGYTWKEAGIDAVQTQFHRLSKNHRNTVEIAAFASGIVAGLKLDDDGTMPDLKAATRHGPKPAVLKGKYNKQLSAAISYIKNKVDLENETVAFLKPQGGRWFADIRDRLEAEGLPYEDITRERIWVNNDVNLVLSTMHSAKGLEFDHVIILGLNQENTPHDDDVDDDQHQLFRRLLAMAVARARKSVVIGYKPSEASGLVKYFAAETIDESDV
ncbi:DNA helicase IV [Agrobacterium pusense]|uniref:3'-5' exonuclease n=1 Tax=Agrobacterium pusense TaxID=648995 RepID=UPI00285445FC|nr:3'-5' exonuclease [Agrobacterium pusense]MDR6188439.1 DNA helicase IV [Agrobacterium pusense]